MGVITHGQKGTRLYGTWTNIITRCENPNIKEYKYYGGRGIVICHEWRKDFVAFMTWALTNGYKEGLQIDRIDNAGDYTPENCRFVTAKEQARNRRNNKPIQIGSETKLLCEWAEQTRITRQAFMKRIELGWPESRLLEPAKP